MSFRRRSSILIIAAAAQTGGQGPVALSAAAVCGCNASASPSSTQAISGAAKTGVVVATTPDLAQALVTAAVARVNGIGSPASSQTLVCAMLLGSVASATPTEGQALTASARLGVTVAAGLASNNRLSATILSGVVGSGSPDETQALNAAILVGVSSQANLNANSSISNALTATIVVGVVGNGPLPIGGPPDPTLLPIATTAQSPLTTVYNSLNVPGLAAGSKYLDPTTGININKLTSASFPAASSSFNHDYAEGGDEVSLPYKADGVTRAILIRASDGVYRLIDWTPGVGVSNARTLGAFSPFMDVAFTFSNNPATPWYAYTSTGSSIVRFDIRTLTAAPLAGVWPQSEATAAWLHQSENDGFFVWIRGSGGSTIAMLEVASGTVKTYTNVGINEPRIDRAGRYVGVSMTTPINGLVVWDWQTASVVWTSTGDPGIPFAHVASQRGQWLGVDWNESYPPRYTEFFSAAGPAIHLTGPANATLVHGSGNWIQHPSNVGDQWAMFSNYGELVPSFPSAWLAPGGMIWVSANGGRRLLGHSYNTSGTYTYNTFVKPSSDGKVVLFNSNMNGAARSDVFLAEMPSSGGTGVSGVLTWSQALSGAERHGIAGVGALAELQALISSGRLGTAGSGALAELQALSASAVSGVAITAILNLGFPGQLSAKFVSGVTGRVSPSSLQALAALSMSGVASSSVPVESQALSAAASTGVVVAGVLSLAPSSNLSAAIVVGCSVMASLASIQALSARAIMGVSAVGYLNDESIPVPISSSGLRGSTYTQSISGSDTPSGLKGWL